MNIFNRIILKIKRRETKFYDFLYRFLKALFRFQLPSIKCIHLPLYYFHYIILNLIKRFIHGTWSIPLFKARCQQAGKGLNLPNGIPLVMGTHLNIYLGDNVSIGRSTIGSSKIYNEPNLIIGNNTAIHYGAVFSIAQEVRIGDNSLVAINCLIMDNDDHPIDPAQRLAGQTVSKDEVEPILIEDNVWIGAFSAILKGVTIGSNSIVATHSVVTTNVPPNSIVAGVPAKIVRTDIDKLD